MLRDLADDIALLDNTSRSMKDLTSETQAEADNRYQSPKTKIPKVSKLNDDDKWWNILTLSATPIA